jgi:hypothetical protein
MARLKEAIAPEPVFEDIEHRAPIDEVPHWVADKLAELSELIRDLERERDQIVRVVKAYEGWHPP